MEITLEKIDLIRERTGVSYAEAKEALTITDGDVVDALIYLENKVQSEKDCKNSEIKEEIYTSLEDLKSWLKELIKKGNLSRIKIKKDDKIIVDVPVNTGIAAGILACIWTPIVVIGVATAVVAKLTIEITKEDGSVEVVNAIVKNVVNETMDKFNNIKEDVKDKFSKESDVDLDGKVYTYTVNLENEDEDEPIVTVNGLDVEDSSDKTEDKETEDK